MAWRNFYLLVFVVIVIVAGCNDDESADRGQTEERDEEVGVETYDADDVAEDVADDEAASEEETDAATDDVTEVDVSEQMIIYNGDISIEVEQFEEAQRQIEDHVDDMDGYVVESTVHDRNSDDRSGAFSVRIPQENFTVFLDEVASIGTDVLERSTYGDDVTEEYVDLESRLRTQEAVEERLLTFMEEAETTEDLLDISDDLASTQEEIEQIEGRMNYLEDHVAYATVDIQVQEVAASTLQDQDSLNTWGQATSLFTDTINVLMSFFSGLVIFATGLSPVLVPLLAIAVTLTIIWRRKRRQMN
ncbi:DUF4349 domain-containing protein [Natribacillus halophilus]|uniref:DUF4349 domain-containing protein n=1 Tax=Natribacillus halophilus TaxID=549003 RepID=A0A1G8QNQ8_9BACI|nr:DUF4349 domain-containing protein [Natribacillus halophilus]SDJ06251.1 protein of unknown function [Natribacillus halophilus]